MSEKISRINIPLCVDLDGTLLKTDLLYESIIYLLKKNFFYIFLLPIWVLKGKYYFKVKILEYVSPTVTSLPYNIEVINFIRNEKYNGRKIVLVTASHQSLAEKVAEFTGIFDEVYGSINEINLNGNEKSQLLCNKFGVKGFDYIGNSFKDIPVWENSYKSHIVSDDKSLLTAASEVSDVEKIFSNNTNNFRIIIQQIRVHQWIKNLLIFLPVLLAHKAEFQEYINAFWGFLSFSFIASAIYVINDLADIESDRNHANKKNRPAASGKITILTCIELIPILIILGFAISIFTLGYLFTLILLLYTVITTLYSFKLKKLYLLDMITLSLLYSIRLISGGIATDTQISPWLFNFSLFIFLSLGALKRYTELKGLIEDNKTKTRGRDYYVEDIPLISIIGISSGFVAALVFTLYITNPEVIILYKNPFFLYMIIPVLLYWILRMWFIAHRGAMHDDPIIFAIKDKASYAVTFIIILIALGATV